MGIEDADRSYWLPVSPLLSRGPAGAANGGRWVEQKISRGQQETLCFNGMGAGCGCRPSVHCNNLIDLPWKDKNHPERDFTRLDGC